MKLISYRADSGPTYGFATATQPDGHGPLTLRPASKCLGSDVPPLPDFIGRYSEDAAFRRRVLAALESAPVEAVPADRLLPCVPHPGKIVCLGVNYAAHAAEGGNTVADFPALFLRCTTSLLPHLGSIPVPAVSTFLDFEAELAVVLGQRLRHAREDQVLEAVFGYSCFNDATLRDYQKRTSQWTIGKNFDATGGFGPWIVTADSLPAGADGLAIESRLNGRVMQSSTTDRMIFKVARTLALLSDCMTLEPGDVVVMGTPEGVGYARKPPVWMQPGDVIEVEIGQVGLLRNTVGAPAQAALPAGSRVSEAVRS